VTNEGLIEAKGRLSMAADLTEKEREVRARGSSRTPSPTMLRRFAEADRAYDSPNRKLLDFEEYRKERNARIKGA
jgi:hypothetical protein